MTQLYLLSLNGDRNVIWITVKCFILYKATFNILSRNKIKKKDGYRIIADQSVPLGVCFGQIQLFFDKDRLVKSCLRVPFYFCKKYVLWLIGVYS